MVENYLDCISMAMSILRNLPVFSAKATPLETDVFIRLLHDLFVKWFLLTFLIQLMKVNVDKACGSLEHGDSI